MQIAAVGVVVALTAYLVHNTIVNMARAGIASGFGYLGGQASFEIGESLIRYSPTDTYARALLVGVVNTLVIAALGIVFSTVLGTIIGIARLAQNWLVRVLALVYVEAVRNVPLLLQLIVWWDLLRVSAPPARQAWQPLPGVFVSVRGIVFPVPQWSPAYAWMLLAFVLGIAAAWSATAWGQRRHAVTGREPPVFAISVLCIVGLPLAVFLLAGAPWTWSWPTLRVFNFVGGASLSPEFSALLVGLVVYTAAFIAEIVRSGIEGVSGGQSEAAAALGLRRGLALRLVVLPQALRVIVPPMISQFLNLTKNSSLAILIGYPDIVSVAETTLNQTGQAIEGIAIIMAVFLTISLSISGFMNWYNKKIALVER